MWNELPEAQGPQADREPSRYRTVGLRQIKRRQMHLGGIRAGPYRQSGVRDVPGLKFVRQTE